jgi:hypothetical protein
MSGWLVVSLLMMAATGLAGFALWRTALLRSRIERAMCNKQKLKIVSCVRCGEIGEPMVVSGEEDARLACRVCLGFALEPVEGVSEPSPQRPA